MKLSLGLAELERGFSVQAGPKERQLDLAVMANRKEPIAITPVTNHDRKVISAVLLTEAVAYGRETEIKFRPIWCRIFTVFATKPTKTAKERLAAVVVQTDKGQYWLDKETYHISQLTLNGNGADPEVSRKAQYVLGDMLQQDYRSDIILNLIRFLKEQF